jgi:hypothetical protein
MANASARSNKGRADEYSGCTSIRLKQQKQKLRVPSAIIIWAITWPNVIARDRQTVLIRDEIDGPCVVIFDIIPPVHVISMAFH